VYETIVISERFLVMETGKSAVTSLANKTEDPKPSHYA
jgi:hypothetical protein